MKVDKTTIIIVKDVEKEEIKEDLISIFNDLDEIGYDSTKQIVAYLISGDPGYISSHNDCRSRILKYKREDIIETMLINFTSK